MSFYNEYHNWFVVIGMLLIIGVIVSSLFPKQLHSLIQFNRNIENDIYGIPNNWYAIIGGTFFMLMIGIIIKTIMYDNYNNWYAIIGGTFFILLIGIIIKIIVIVIVISLFPKTIS